MELEFTQNLLASWKKVLQNQNKDFTKGFHRPINLMAHMVPTFCTQSTLFLVFNTSNPYMEKTATTLASLCQQAHLKITASTSPNFMKVSLLTVTDNTVVMQEKKQSPKKQALELLQKKITLEKMKAGKSRKGMNKGGGRSQQYF